VLLLRHEDQEYNNPLASFAICLCNSALTFRDFAPRLELLTIFRDFQKSMKTSEINYFSLFCKSYSVLFLTFIIGTPILCCTITDLGFFGTVLGIFGV